MTTLPSTGSVPRFSPQRSQMPSLFSSMWPSAAISSVLVSPQTVQVKVLTPFSVQVASVVTLPSSQVWPLAGISTVLVAPQSLQVTTFSPFSVQVGSLVTLPSSQTCSQGAVALAKTVIIFANSARVALSPGRSLPSEPPMIFMEMAQLKASFA